MGYDRNEVLERTDLGALADQLVGPHKGQGAGATWPCPDPGHGDRTLETDLDQAGVDPGLAAAQRWAFDHGLVPTADLNPAGPDLKPLGPDGLAIDF